jgi:hypothetical protein
MAEFGTDTDSGIGTEAGADNNAEPLVAIGVLFADGVLPAGSTGVMSLIC